MSGLEITGFEMVERMRADHQIDLLVGDRRHITAMLSPGDERQRLDALLHGLRAVADGPPSTPGRTMNLPPLADFQRELAMAPRAAYFSRAEQIPAGQGDRPGMRGDDQPLPPGTPVLLPGEVITAPVLDYLRSGASIGFLIPTPPIPP